MKVMIIVTHLLGTGHLARALTLQQAFREGGHSAWIISGGLPAPQLRGADDVIQLEPLRSDGVNFTRLLNRRGAPADRAVFTARSALLLDSLAQIRPDVVITELFPFGRRVLRDEFITLLQAANAMTPRPMIYSSVRDILAPPSKPAKAAEAEALSVRFYDAVLVHSDAAITPLDLSWPVSDLLRQRLRYTGYVSPPSAGPHPEKAGRGEVLVSAGGGAVGGPVFEAALAAARLHPDQIWRLLIGGSDAKTRAAQIAVTAPANAIVEPARPDFRQMLHHAEASVSLCGYNTALDILQAGTPAVFIPFNEGGEVEQGLRAEALARLDGISVLRSANLTPGHLSGCLAAVRGAPRRAPCGDLSGGAAETVNIVGALAEQRA